MGELFIVVVTVFWMIVGWRAMRAHERIADAASQAVRTPVEFFEKRT
jgi:uncharacterized membrane protein